MPGPDYEEILASLQKIVHQAYVLGRTDALKQVVEVLQGGETAAKPLALMAPAENAPPPVAPEDITKRVADEPPAMAEPVMTEQAGAKADQDATKTAEQPAHEPDSRPWWYRSPRAA